MSTKRVQFAAYVLARLMVGLCLLSPFSARATDNLRAFGVPEPNDPGFTTNVKNIDRQWGLAEAGFFGAWAQSMGSGAVVAVVDTGIDFTHEDLKDVSQVAGYDFLSDQAIPVGIDSDNNGHGTLVAGVLAATANNGVGVVGAAPKVTLMPIKALDASGNGNAQAVAKAIVWATDHKASIINISLGGTGFGQDLPLSDAVRYAFNHNVLIVAAAGNDTALKGGDIDSDPVFPICDDNGQNMVVGVTALDQNDQKPQFANYGKTCVDVAAPGKRVLSTIGRDPVTRARLPNSYAYASGTSMAAPFVSAEAALLRSLYPTATNRQIRDRIIAATDPIDLLNAFQCGGPCFGKLGSGRINVLTAVSAEIIPETIAEGTLVQVIENGELFYITGGKRQPVGSFVRSQRFSGVEPRRVYTYQLADFLFGQYTAPVDGTLVKDVGSATVYWMQNGLRLPVSYSIFMQRGLRFDRVITLESGETQSWLIGKALPPTDGTLVRGLLGKTVYWVVGGSLHPVSGAFYRARGLSVFPLLKVNDGDLRLMPRGEPYL